MNNGRRSLRQDDAGNPPIMPMVLAHILTKEQMEFGLSLAEVDGKAVLSYHGEAIKEFGYQEFLENIQKFAHCYMELSKSVKIERT